MTQLVLCMHVVCCTDTWKAFNLAMWKRHTDNKKYDIGDIDVLGYPGSNGTGGTNLLRYILDR